MLEYVPMDDSEYNEGNEIAREDSVVFTEEEFDKLSKQYGPKKSKPKPEKSVMSKKAIYAIATLQNVDGTYDEVGMNNRMIVNDLTTERGIKRRVASRPRFCGRKYKITYYRSMHGDNAPYNIEYCNGATQYLEKQEPTEKQKLHESLKLYFRQVFAEFQSDGLIISDDRKECIEKHVVDLTHFVKEWGLEMMEKSGLRIVEIMQLVDVATEELERQLIDENVVEPAPRIATPKKEKKDNKHYEVVQGPKCIRCRKELKPMDDVYFYTNQSNTGFNEMKCVEAIRFTDNMYHQDKNLCDMEKVPSTKKVNGKRSVIK